jgi:hypothetical protein
MSMALAVIAVASLIVIVSHYWAADLPLAKPSPNLTFWRWVCAGIVAPLLVWCFFNSGLAVSPLLPQIAMAQKSGSWGDLFARYAVGVAFIITTWWAAVSMAWLAWHNGARAPDRRLLFNTIIVALLVGLPVAGLIVAIFEQAGLGLALAVAFGAVVHGTRNLVPVKLPPSYSRAQARIAFDRFNDAEWEIIKELESQENDFNGWMLLAELYATHFNDLPSAERTICELCDDPNTDFSQVAVALNRLADWQVKADRKANARWALEQICRKMPGTHMAKMAEARIRRLDESPEEDQSRKSAPIKITPLPDVVPSRPNTPFPSSSEPSHEWNAPTIPMRLETKIDPRVAALEEANQCVQHLTANPNDMAARERFAAIMAEKLGKGAEGIAQLNLLLTMPGTSPEKRAGWLAMEADWQSRLLHDIAAARTLLQRIVQDFPNSPHAFEAQRRLYVLQLESAVRQRRRAAS